MALFRHSDDHGEESGEADALATGNSGNSDNSEKTEDLVKPGKADESGKQDGSEETDAFNNSRKKTKAVKSTKSKTTMTKTSATKSGAAKTTDTPRNVKVAQAVGVVLGILLVAAVIGIIVFLASRTSASEDESAYSTDWSTPSDAPSGTSSATLERVGATYQLDGTNGTADFGNSQSIAWSAVSTNGKLALHYTNSMGVPIKSFSVIYSLKSSASASDVKAAITASGGSISSDIDDTELATWQIGCTGTSYSASGAEGQTATCVLGGYELTDVSQMDAFRPISLSLTSVDTSAGHIDDYAYSFTSNSATETTESTIGGWPSDDISARIPEPASSQVYYNVRETDEGMAFSIVKTDDDSVYDAYVSQCKDMGWTVESAADGSTTFASKDGYTLTVANNDGTSSVDVLLLSDSASDSDSASSTASASSSE